MQTNRAIGKITQTTNIYRILVLSLHIVVCFPWPIAVKALLHGFEPYILCFTCVLNVPRSYVPVLLSLIHI